MVLNQQPVILEEYHTEYAIWPIKTLTCPFCLTFPCTHRRVGRAWRNRNPLIRMMEMEENPTGKRPLESPRLLYGMRRLSEKIRGISKFSVRLESTCS